MLAVSGCSGKTAETAAQSSAAETLTEGNASAAGSSSNNEGTGTGAEGTGTGAEGEGSASEEGPAEAASSGVLAAGNYIDSSENHLSLFYLTKEDGYDKDGWAVMAILEDTLYSGEPA